MERVSLPEIIGLSSSDLAQYDRFPSNLTRALLRTSNCTRGYLDLGFALRSTRLDPKHYELVILRVASLSNSAYERMQHLPPARKVGWSDADIEAIEEGSGSTLDDTSRALLSFVDECVRDVRVSARTFEHCRDFFSEGALADATLLTGFYMMTARFLETLGVALDEAPCDVLMTR